MLHLPNYLLDSSVVHWFDSMHELFFPCFWMVHSSSEMLPIFVHGSGYRGSRAAHLLIQPNLLKSLSQAWMPVPLLGRIFLDPDPNPRPGISDNVLKLLVPKTDQMEKADNIFSLKQTLRADLLNYCWFPRSYKQCHSIEGSRSKEVKVRSKGCYITDQMKFCVQLK